jgi:hypothetical protein
MALAAMHVLNVRSTSLCDRDFPADTVPLALSWLLGWAASAEHAERLVGVVQACHRFQDDAVMMMELSNVR